MLFDYIIRVMCVVWFITVYKTNREIMWGGFMVWLWEFSYIYFEYVTQVPRHKRNFKTDIPLILTLSIGLLFTIVPCFLKVVRFKFAFYNVEWIIRYTLCLALYTMTLWKDVPQWRLYWLIVYMVCAVISQSVFYYMSRDWRNYEERERRKRMELEAQESQMHIQQLEAAHEMADDDDEMLTRVMS